MLIPSLSLSLSQFLWLLKFELSIFTFEEIFPDCSNRVFQRQQNSLRQETSFKPFYLLFQGCLKKRTSVRTKLKRKDRDIDTANFPFLLFNISIFEHSVRLIIALHANIYPTPLSPSHTCTIQTSLLLWQQLMYMYTRVVLFFLPSLSIWSCSMCLPHVMRCFHSSKVRRSIASCCIS